LARGDLFKDAEGLTWRVANVTAKGFKAVPWSVKSGRFLSLRNGKVFGFSSASAKTVKVFNKVTGNAAASLVETFNLVPSFGRFKPARITGSLKTSLVQAIKIMSDNGFNPQLANLLSKTRFRVRAFDMGRYRHHQDFTGAGLGGNEAVWNGMYWRGNRAMGMSMSGGTPVGTWIHEFGHHLDFSLVRKRGGVFSAGRHSTESKAALLKLRRTHKAMMAEYRSASKTVSQRIGLGNKVMSPAIQKRNWTQIQNNTTGVAQSSYSLNNEFEWFAEAHAHYFNQRGSRNFMQRYQPKTFAFFELLNSSEMEVLWKELAG